MRARSALADCDFRFDSFGGFRLMSAQGLGMTGPQQDRPNFQNQFTMNEAGNLRGNSRQLKLKEPVDKLRILSII
jgi:hypothetical protein